MARPRALLAILMAVILLALTACTDDAPDKEEGRGKHEAHLVVHPQIAQPGALAAAADAADAAMTAMFTPVAQGRSVVLQRKVGDGWTDVATGVQDDRGVAEFTAPYALNGEAQTYRTYTAGTGALPRATSPAVSTSTWRTPTFSDEFDGDALTDVWADRLQGYSVESKRGCSKADPKAVGVSDGLLRLSVMADPQRHSTCSYDGEEFRWRLNGHIGTQGRAAFTYGYATARIRFQPRAGQHGSFWMQPDEPTADEGSALETGAEIDVIEWFGIGGVCSFIYDYPDDGNPEGTTPRKTGRCIKNPEEYGRRWAERFHVFSVEWTPERYIFRIDGRETFRTRVGVSGQPQYLILSLLSSDYELARLGGDDRLPQHMYVDWVRYWER